MAKSSLSAKLAGLFNAQRQATAELRRDHDGISDEIIVLQNRLGEVRRAPVERSEIERRIDLFLAAEESQARNVFIPEVTSLPDGSAGRMQIDELVGRPRTAFGGLLICGLRPIIREALVSEALAAMAGEPMTDAERAKEVARLESEIDGLERLREKIIRDGESSGLAIARSEHASAAALLAPDSEL